MVCPLLLAVNRSRANQYSRQPQRSTIFQHGAHGLLGLIYAHVELCRYSLQAVQRLAVIQVAVRFRDQAQLFCRVSHEGIH